MFKKITLSISVLFFSFQLSAQLVINELNQGPSGNPPTEFVELLVVGTKTCTDSCANLQNWILDDNNGFFGTAGIAAGHIRFNSDPQWQCVPYGSIIVVYNPLSAFVGITIDETDANNDNVYFLPSTSSYFESDLTTPLGGTVSSTYAGATYTAGGADWDVLGMQNGNDAFQVVAPTNLTAGYHSVGWGSTAATTINFAGGASNTVFQNENIADNDPFVQTNWASQVQTVGTPGIANTSNNLAWINTMKTPATNCDFCISDATFWVKGDTGALNGAANVTAGTVSTWENLVPNTNIPNLDASGAPQLLQNLAEFNFNSAMHLQNNSFAKTPLVFDDLVAPSQGAMFVVASSPSLAFNFAVTGGSTGTCGGNRCSTGFRWNRSEYAADDNLFATPANTGIANVMSMTANDNTSSHFNSVNGTESINTSVSSLTSQTAPFSLNIGSWPGFVTSNLYVAEALAFNRELSQNEVYRVESYLALKYGVNMAHSYLNSANNVLWTIGNGFDSNVAGISRDDCFGLNQLKSKSVHPNSSLTVALTDNGGTFANPNDFTNDLSTLVWGNDNNALTFSCSNNTPSTHDLLLARNWLSRTTGSVGNVSLSFDLTPFSSFTAADVALVLDLSQNGLYSDETAILPTSIVGNELFFDNISLPDSISFSLVMIGNFVYDNASQTICDTDSFLFAGNYYSTIGTYTDTIACDTIRTLTLNVQICTTCDIDFGNDTLICGPINQVLDAGLFDEYLWQNGSTNQTFTATSAGTYWCQGLNFDTTNLVVNPGFESGNVNFLTDYTLGTGGTFGLISNAGTYGVASSPSMVHNNFTFCGDHTTGTGNMMIVNGSNTANQAVWCQTISVVPNTDYYFSIWATSVESTNPTNVSSLYFELNGSQIGTNFSPPLNACNWQEYTQTWNSGASITVDLCIYNHTISGNNDFAIDDIFFGETCVATDTIEITTPPTTTLFNTLNACFNDSVLIYGQMQGATGVYRDTLQSVAACDSIYYQTLVIFGSEISSTQNEFICNTDSMFLQNAWQNTNGVYTDTLQSINGCDSLVYTTLVVSDAAISDTLIVCTNNPLGVGTIIVDTIPNIAACDSVYVYETSIFNAPSTDTVLVCTNNPLAVGTFIIDTIPNALNCDSIYNYQTTFLVVADSSFSLSCTNNPTLAEARVDTFRNALLCDSFYAFVDITYLVPLDIIIVDTCTNIQANALSFIDTLSTFNGCDSVYRRNTVNYIGPDTNYLATICTNDASQAALNIIDFVSYQGCDSASTVQEFVYILPDTTFLPDLEICFGNTENIFGVNQNSSGLYENNILSVGGCDSITQFQNLIVNPLPIVFAGADTTIAEGDNVLLQASGASIYAWNTGDLGESVNIVPLETQNYTVVGVDTNNCEDIDSITVFVILEEIILAIPTGFSPNGDGTNDMFRIVNEGIFEDISMKVFNRWGEMVYQNTRNGAAWDGSYKNQKQNIGEYVYYIEATAKKNGQKYTAKGTVSLIR